MKIVIIKIADGSIHSSIQHSDTDDEEFDSNLNEGVEILHRFPCHGDSSLLIDTLSRFNIDIEENDHVGALIREIVDHTYELGAGLTPRAKWSIRDA